MAVSIPSTFLSGKKKFGFPATADYKPLYDACIVCAEHRPDADNIITSFSVKERTKLGIYGLAKRVRDRINEREGGLRKPHKPSDKPRPTVSQKRKDAEARAAHAEEQLAAAGGGSLFDLKKDSVKSIARVIVDISLSRLQSLQKEIAEGIKYKKAGNGAHAG